MVSIPKITANVPKTSLMATRKIIHGCMNPELYVKDRWTPLAYQAPKFKTGMDFIKGLKYLKSSI